MKICEAAFSFRSARDPRPQSCLSAPRSHIFGRQQSCLSCSKVTYFRTSSAARDACLFLRDAQQDAKSAARCIPYVQVAQQKQSSQHMSPEEIFQILLVLIFNFDIKKSDGVGHFERATCAGRGRIPFLDNARSTPAELAPSTQARPTPHFLARAAQAGSDAI